MEEDRLFQKPITKRFEFDEAVASVFDDMISRSVPFYKEVQELIAQLLLANFPSSGRLYDLGSSTGATLFHLYRRGLRGQLIGIDNAQAMVEEARKRARAYGAQVSFELADILHYPYQEANAFIANYTLQFVRPLKREPFIQRLYDHLRPDGLFIMSEKIMSEDRRLDKQLVDIYFDYKRKMGYSDFEIAQKREALEHVLIPFSLKENEEMLQRAGFSHVETIFRWANFATILARK
ncbi:MAG: carboxy-S-adenosyl-L-methionine synthase CmoA [Nitratiruptor sp.]|nr:carboxy-S-adenosyl-L-methionine synthase CmoA [Nitratiruptor sp.]NPA83925.1 carboxy-S-adenosyl-L-methionine synthase CmoA [Campylobacterota bacterium]